MVGAWKDTNTLLRHNEKIHNGRKQTFRIPGQNDYEILHFINYLNLSIMSKLSILKKDLRQSSVLTKGQALRLKGGDDKRVKPPATGWGGNDNGGSGGGAGGGA